MEIINTFEEYLERRCFEENPTVLDDDMPDFFDSWLGDQDIDAIIIYADSWMLDTKNAIAAEVKTLF
jgi:hypothetical protein